MLRDSNTLLVEAERLRKENAALQQQLREAKESIEAIKTGAVDAVVFTGESDLKIYTQSTADKTYRVLIEKMNEGAVALSSEGTILYCNSCFAKMVKLPLQKVTGIQFKKFIDKTVQKHIEILLKQGSEKVVKKEAYLHASNGYKIPVLMTATGFVLDAAFVVSIILTDLTVQKKDHEELKLKSKQLEQKNSELFFEIEEKEKRSSELTIANKELESFTYVSSHDLQEPLRKIQTFAARILEKENAVLSDTGKDYLVRMTKAANRMQALIKDLLAYSQTSITDRKLDSTDLQKILEEVKEELTENILEKEAVIEASLAGEAFINPFQFRQVLHNLLSNALKFSLPGVPPYIKIESEIREGIKLENENLSPKKSYCHIRFSDNGIGFDPEYKDKIFEVFQRLHNKEKYEGTGIGLAIVKKIIDNNEGIITATSELGKGVRFDIYLPA